MRNLLYLTLFCAACVVVSSEAGGKRGFGGIKKMFMEKLKKCGDGEINLAEALKGSKECWKEVSSRRRRSPEADSSEEESDGGKGGKNLSGKGKGGGFRGMFGRYKNKMCVAVCQWKKIGMLDDSGSFSESGAGEFVTRLYPEQFQANMTTEMTTCATDNSSKFSMDNNCSGYTEFKKCVVKAHIRTCGIKMNFGFGKGKKVDEDEEDED